MGQNETTEGLGQEQPVAFRQEVNLPSTTYGAFALYRYPAKFIPHVVAYIMERYAKKQDTVFDPFAGYGTVGAVARMYGNAYELWDLNPLLKILHRISVLEPREIDIPGLIQRLRESTTYYRPDWSRFDYWFPKEFQSLLSRSWGGYYTLDSEYEQLLLTIPLLKVSRQFSFDDMGRMKLSSSPHSRARVKNLLKENWEDRFFELLIRETLTIQRKLREAASVATLPTTARIRAGVDTLTERLTENKDLLITSPPYLQSQEYIRYAKMDLFWLGYSEEEVKRLGRLEVPYRKIQPFPIDSPTYDTFLRKIDEEHMRMVYESYFHALIGALTRLQDQINQRMCVFVGRASLRGRQVPIDQIITEHFTQQGWKHEVTLVDTIVSRRMFSYKINPATKRKDKRTTSESLVILRK